MPVDNCQVCLYNEELGAEKKQTKHQTTTTKKPSELMEEQVSEECYRSAMSEEERILLVLCLETLHPFSRHVSKDFKLFDATWLFGFYSFGRNTALRLKPGEGL